MKESIIYAINRLMIEALGNSDILFPDGFMFIAAEGGGGGRGEGGGSTFAGGFESLSPDACAVTGNPRT